MIDLGEEIFLDLNHVLIPKIRGIRKLIDKLKYELGKKWYM